jgi:hypothetical protein
MVSHPADPNISFIGGSVQVTQLEKHLTEDQVVEVSSNIDAHIYIGKYHQNI